MEERIPKDHSTGLRKADGRRKMRIFKPEDKTGWRVVHPDKEASESLADLRDLCFRPPVDPNEEHKADRGSTSATAGLAMFALEALYDDATMEKAKVSFQFNDGTDVVRKALAGLFAMQDEPDRHRYKPNFKDDTPPREPNIALDTVAARLIATLQRDFAPEIEAIKAEAASRQPPPQ